MHERPEGLGDQVVRLPAQQRGDGGGDPLGDALQVGAEDHITLR